MPRVITTDKYTATEVTILEEIYSGALSCKVQHRMVKYLNSCGTRSSLNGLMTPIQLAGFIHSLMKVGNKLKFQKSFSALSNTF